MKNTISKTVDEDNAYFTLRWSRLSKADKYEIIKKVPAMAGIFELYYMDAKKKLNLFFVGKVWIGGLRSRIRRLTDPELEMDTKRRAVLEKFDCYYRYSLTDHQSDLDDVFYFFAGRHFPRETKAEHSGRYSQILVYELSSDKLITI